MTAAPDHEEVRLPRSAVEALVRSAATDPDGVARALREAGRAAGAELAARIGELAPADRISMAEFWSAVNAEAEARGLGEFRSAPLTEAVAGISSSRTVEALAAAGRTDDSSDSAPFTEGFIEGLLTEAAGEPVASLLTRTSAGGAHDSPELVFLVGAPSYLRILRLRLEAGEDLTGLLEES